MRTQDCASEQVSNRLGKAYAFEPATLFYVSDWT